jgi:subtilase family serine protease
MKFLASALRAAVLLVMAGAVPILAQAPEQPDSSPVRSAAGRIPATPDRIVQEADDSQLAPITGNTHPLARPEFDRGPVDSGMVLEHMQLLIERSPLQEAALAAFMDGQLDPASPDYHHWLTPEEFGALYGPSDHDIQAITAWLQTHGFTVDGVSPGRVFVDFTGTAAMVEGAFHTQIHRYVVNNEEHIANDRDPSIPAALRPVIAGVLSLNSFFSVPAHISLGDFRRDPETGKWRQVNMPEEEPRPAFGVTSNKTNYEAVSPWDFATIYNVTGAWDAQLDGTGQTIAIAGRSNISLTDVATFRSAFNLPTNAPTVVLNGTDPGTSSANDRLENTLDVEWSGAIAKNATIKLVTTKSTSTSDGAMASAQYIIDHNLAPVMSVSYYQCELFMGTTGNTAYNKMWQQGAAEGISIFVASGDSAAASCDGAFQAKTAASNGLQVSGISSTPYNVAVGGTDFIWANLTTKYWDTKNASNGSSALGYIPEVPWNHSCASDDVNKLLGLFAKGYDEEQSCMYLLNNSASLGNVTVTGGGGGVSACTAPTGTTPAKCAGGYSKPSWQTGTGVPKDGKRDVPDLSLFASDNALNSFYLICDSASTPCKFADANDTMAQGAGGTSIATPAMAGIMALIVEKSEGAPQGLPNPVFYTLASKENLTNCSPLMVTSGTSCVFYDVNQDNNAAPCLPGTTNCTVETKGDTVGILSGYKAGVGYDLATGLGSVNAENLINAWGSVAPLPGVSLSATKLTFPSTAVGKGSASQTITVKNTGSGWLIFPSGKVGIFGGNNDSFPATTTCTAPVAPGGTCVVTVTFKPTIAGSLQSTAQVGDNAAGSPQQATLVGTATGGTPAVTLSTSKLTFASTVVGQSSAAQTVTLKNSGNGVLTFPANPIVITGGSSGSFSMQTTCSGSLTPGNSCTVAVTFKPQTAGSLLSNLQIVDNAAGEPQIVVLSGTATPGLVLQLSSNTATFFNTQVGAQSIATQFYAANTSPYPVTINPLSVTGPNASSFIALSGCPASLPGGQSCYLYIAFKPTTAGTLNASVNVSDSADASAQSISLTGTSHAVPKVSISPTSITFPTTAKGTIATVIPITVTNQATDNTELQVISIAITGANAQSFLEVSDCNVYVFGFLPCHVYVAFAPTAAGAANATLTITDSGAQSPQTVTLTGTGK